MGPNQQDQCPDKKRRLERRHTQRGEDGRLHAKVRGLGQPVPPTARTPAAGLRSAGPFQWLGRPDCTPNRPRKEVERVLPPADLPPRRALGCTAFQGLEPVCTDCGRRLAGPRHSSGARWAPSSWSAHAGALVGSPARRQSTGKRAGWLGESDRTPWGKDDAGETEQGAGLGGPWVAVGQVRGGDQAFRETSSLSLCRSTWCSQRPY